VAAGSAPRHLLPGLHAPAVAARSSIEVKPRPSTNGRGQIPPKGENQWAGPHSPFGVIPRVPPKRLYRPHPCVYGEAKEIDVFGLILIWLLHAAPLQITRRSGRHRPGSASRCTGSLNCARKWRGSNVNCQRLRCDPKRSSSAERAVHPMNKSLIIISHTLEDHDFAARLARFLTAHTGTTFDLALAALGALVFPDCPLAGRDLRTSGQVALHIVVASRVALESHWLAVVAGFSKAMEIPTIFLRFRDTPGDLPSSLRWFESVELSWPHGWQIFCEKCRLKCRAFPAFMPSQAEHAGISKGEPAKLPATLLSQSKECLTLLEDIYTAIP
jgi:hypothetical protein